MKDITTEEATQIMRNHICWIENKTVKQAIEKVLNELEKYKELYISTLGHSLNNSIKQNNKHNNDLEALNEGWKIELEKKDKIINAMASYISRFDNDETICKGIDCYDQIYGCRTCIKQYFKMKTSDGIELDLIETKYYEELLDLYKQEKENRRMAEHNYDELTKTTGRLETELEEEKKKVRTTIIGRIDQVSLDDLIGDKYISKDKIKTLKENFNKKQSSFMYRSK